MNLDLLGGPFATVFDVGGSVGSFAEACHRRWPTAAIFSFEPLRDVAAENRANACGRWRTLAYGLDATVGPRTMQRNLGSSQASTLLQPGTIRRDAFGVAESYRPAEAVFWTLDDHHGSIEPPALLKIDTEGAELRVLAGGERSALPLFETVVIEVNESPDVYVDAPTPTEVEDHMETFGFRLHGRAGELRDPRDGSLIQWDGIWRRAA